jgi:hypothetical protein
MMDARRDVRAGAQQRRRSRAHFALAYGIPDPDKSQLRMASRGPISVPSRRC